MTNDLNEQLIELQTKIQFQDDVIHKLDDELIQQNELIAQLALRLKVLEEKVKEMDLERTNPTSVSDEKPPHY